MRHNIISESGRTYVTLSVEDWNRIVALVEALKKWRSRHLSKDEIAVYKALDELEKE